MTLTQPFLLDNMHDEQTLQSASSGNDCCFKPTYPVTATSNAGMKLVVGSEFKPTNIVAAAPATSSFTYMANLNLAPAFTPSN